MKTIKFGVYSLEVPNHVEVLALPKFITAMLIVQGKLILKMDEQGTVAVIMPPVMKGDPGGLSIDFQGSDNLICEQEFMLSQSFEEVQDIIAYNFPDKPKAPRTVLGNLVELGLDGHYDVIVHGCNCHCTMGSGIAREIKEKIPEAYEADLATTKGDKSKIGSFTYWSVRNRLGENLTVINAYTQYDFLPRNVDHVEYEGLRKIFKKLNNEYKGSEPGFTIAYPAIGAGLANGNWHKISQIINEELIDVNHVFVKFNG